MLQVAANGMRFLGVVLLGCVLSFVAYQVMEELTARWIVVLLLALLGVAVAISLHRIFSHFILIVTLFCIPLATATKWFLPGGYAPDEEYALTYSGQFSIGLIDALLIGLYMSWFYRIFINRQQPLPSLILLDWLIVWFVLAHLLATIDSFDPVAGLGSTEYLLKHVLFYYYMSRHVDERYLPWVLAAFAFTIVIDVGLSSIQFTTGKLVGIAYDKGAGSSLLNRQYTVPGIETYSRATGTSYDSHNLGEFVGAILPFALVLSLTPRLRPGLRLACIAAFGGALLVVILSLSRTGYVASSIALTTGILLILGLWRERHVLPILAGSIIVVALAVPMVAPFFYERFANSPKGTIIMRFLEFEDAWNMYLLYPVFGVGPAHYVHLYKDHNPYHFQVGPVHSSFLWLAVESGIVGVAAYTAIIVNASWRLFSLARRRTDIPGRLGLAALIGLMTIVINDQFNAGFREPIVFLMFWFLIALSVCLPRMAPGAGAILLAPSRRSPGPTPGIAIGGATAGDGK